MDDHTKTKKLDFTSIVELPTVYPNTAEGKKNKDKHLRRKLTTSINRLEGVGKDKDFVSNGETNVADSRIDLDEILSEPEVEKLTPEYLDILFTKHSKKVPIAVRKQVLDYINKVIDCSDPSIGEHFRNTCIDVIATVYNNSSNVTLKDYMSACLFVTYRNAGDTKLRAYSKVFPERVMRMQREGQNMDHLNTYASLYSKNKTVIDVQAKVILPSHLMYHDLYHKAMRTTAEIMENVSNKAYIRLQAADIILNHTKTPEIKQQELNINVNSNEIDQLKDVLFKLSSTQRDSIINGECSVVNVIDQKIYTEED